MSFDSEFLRNTGRTHGRFPVGKMKFESVLLRKKCKDLKTDKMKKTGGETRKLRGKKAARAQHLRRGA